MTPDWKTMVGSGRTRIGEIQVGVGDEPDVADDDELAVATEGEAPPAEEVEGLGGGAAALWIYFPSYPSNDWVNVSGRTGTPERLVSPNPERVLSRRSLAVVFEIFNAVCARFCSMSSIRSVEPEYSICLTTPEEVSI